MTENRITLFDIPIDNLSIEDAINKIIQRLAGEGAVRIYFVNAHGVNVSRIDSEYLHILQKGDCIFADGVGMRWAARAMGTPLLDNVNGTDLFPRLCPLLQESSFRVFLLGAELGVAQKMAEEICKNYPGLAISGWHHGYFSPQEEEEVIQKIRAVKTDLLLAALGVPKQEKWLDEHLHKTGARVGIGVGGLFDFYSNRIPRAPRWMRKMGLEWLYRLYREPKRLWRRYVLGNGYFLLLLVAAYLKIPLDKLDKFKPRLD
ncbi:MAG: WecB/TagA/CpsF family glycosyltransferase [Candidatus Omnitrophota bacterium]